MLTEAQRDLVIHAADELYELAASDHAPRDLDVERARGCLSKLGTVFGHDDGEVAACRHYLAQVLRPRSDRSSIVYSLKNMAYGLRNGLSLRLRGGNRISSVCEPERVRRPHSPR